jgi:hypothetical protein
VIDRPVFDFGVGPSDPLQWHQGQHHQHRRALDRPDDSYQCDEFPFASTKEGAGKGDGNFSVRYVPGTENEQAGRELGNWYGTDRILHGDEYMIYVHSGAG